ncbi:AIM24 family protein [Clostridium hydrogeniformans]|uniref:AIM24 family protein n=1 Tax=Clostridium hydrogeniformans TaxID=349933 RepID=UPI0004860E10|nr:AIM24 family protein [Clostridium hydrogeniformans]
MRTSLKSKNNITKIDEMVGLDTVFQVLEYDSLRGGKDLSTAFALSFMTDSNIKLRQIRILLKDAAVRLEAGALQFMKGDIEIDSRMGGIVGLGKKLISSKLTNEKAFKPLYNGTGEIFLEPSFGHYALIELEDESVVVDDGLFYACEEGVEVGVSSQKSLSSAFFGNESFFQTKISGTGIAVLELPVPESEVIKVKLIDDELKVDGNFAILRSGRIDFTVEKSAKSWIGTGTSGEGLLSVFRGTGEVWLIPTSHIYENISGFNLKGMTNPSGTINTNQGNK